MICKFVLSSWLQLEMIRYGKEMAGGQREEGIIQKKKKPEKKEKFNSKGKLFTNGAQSFGQRREINTKHKSIGEETNRLEVDWQSAPFSFSPQEKRRKVKQIIHIFFCWFCFVTLLNCWLFLFFLFFYTSKITKESPKRLAAWKDPGSILADPCGSLPPPPPNLLQ